jgi:hypothetical protein
MYQQRSDLSVSHVNRLRTVASSMSESSSASDVLVARGRFFPASRLIRGSSWRLARAFDFLPRRSPGRPTGLGHALPRPRRWLQRRPASSDRFAFAGRPASSNRGTIASAAPSASACATWGSARSVSGDRGGGSCSPWAMASSAQPDGFHSVAQGLVARAPPGVHPGRSGTVTP